MLNTINTRIVKDIIVHLLPENPIFSENPNLLRDSIVIGNGILIEMDIAFDEKKLEDIKHSIAPLLQELGVDEYPIISLSSLTTKKNDEVWNQLQSLGDFQALELLLACSDTCGFIHNDKDTIERNIKEIGEKNSVLITAGGRRMIGNDDKWLRFIRKYIIDNMYFFTDQESIKLYASDNQKLTEGQSHSLHK